MTDPVSGTNNRFNEFSAIKIELPDELPHPLSPIELSQPEENLEILEQGALDRLLVSALIERDLKLLERFKTLSKEKFLAAIHFVKSKESGVSAELLREYLKSFTLEERARFR